MSESHISKAMLYKRLSTKATPENIELARGLCQHEVGHLEDLTGKLASL